MVRVLAWMGSALVLAACTRENGAFDETGGGSTAGTAGTTEQGTSRTDGTNGTNSGTGTSTSASSVDGPTSDEPPLTTGVTSLESTTFTSGGPTTSEPPQDCCTPSETPGCAADPELEGAICTLRESCCNVAWDQACVELTEVLGFGICEVDLAQCCEPLATLGCEALAFVEECVCALDESCCLLGWHPGCVNLALAECGSQCDPISTCCFPHPGAGCDVEETQTCVCGPFPDCCVASWGEACVNQAFECGGGAC